MELFDGPTFSESTEVLFRPSSRCMAVERSSGRRRQCRCLPFDDTRKNSEKSYLATWYLTGWRSNYILALAWFVRWS